LGRRWAWRLARGRGDVAGNRDHLGTNQPSLPWGNLGAIIDEEEEEGGEGLFLGLLLADVRDVVVEHLQARSRHHELVLHVALVPEKVIELARDALDPAEPGGVGNDKLPAGDGVFETPDVVEVLLHGPGDAAVKHRGKGGPDQRGALQVEVCFQHVLVQSLLHLEPPLSKQLLECLVAAEPGR